MYVYTYWICYRYLNVYTMKMSYKNSNIHVCMVVWQFILFSNSFCELLDAMVRLSHYPYPGRQGNGIQSPTSFPTYCQKHPEALTMVRSIEKITKCEISRGKGTASMILAKSQYSGNILIVKIFITLTGRKKQSLLDITRKAFGETYRWYWLILAVASSYISHTCKTSQNLYI